MATTKFGKLFFVGSRFALALLRCLVGAVEGHDPRQPIRSEIRSEGEDKSGVVE
jgi:hypothetical protein